MLFLFCFHPLVRHRLHELINQLVVLLPSDSLVLQADVQRVIQQCLSPEIKILNQAINQSIV